MVYTGLNEVHFFLYLLLRYELIKRSDAPRNHNLKNAPRLAANRLGFSPRLEMQIWKNVYAEKVKKRGSDEITVQYRSTTITARENT